MDCVRTVHDLDMLFLYLPRLPLDQLVYVMNKFFPTAIRLATGLPVNRPYCDEYGGVKWRAGGNIGGWDWRKAGCLNDDGSPNYVNIMEAVKNLPPGDYAIDIEPEYNQRAWLMTPKQLANHIEFIDACKHGNPDCRWSFFGTTYPTNPLLLPEGSPKRKEVEAIFPAGMQLWTHFHFLAPQWYPSWAGPIKDENGKPQGKLSKTFYEQWPNGSTYGWPEFKSYIDWHFGLCQIAQIPIRPYVCPYTTMQDINGKWSKKTGKVPFKYQNPWFAEMVDYIDDAMFYYDYSKNTDWPKAFEMLIRRKINQQY